MEFSLFVNTSKALEGEDITTINTFIFFAKQQSGIEKKIFLHSTVYFGKLVRFY